MFKFSLLLRIGDLIDMERKGFELVIYDHDRDLRGTIMGWMDVPDSDWGF